MRKIDWATVAGLLSALYDGSERLEELFPGRRFTLDGHLVGSIGEVIAAYMFDLELLRASTMGHDAMARDGRRVEIKLTQGKSTALRHEPEHLIVLQRSKRKAVEVIYNGPGKPAWDLAGKMASNGQRCIRVSKLKGLNAAVASEARLRVKRKAPV